MVLLPAPAAAAPAFPDLSTFQIPDCDAGARRAAACRNRRDLPEAEARARLGEDTVAWWVSGTELTVVARAPARPMLCCAIQAPLAQLPGTDLWTLSLSIPRLEEAVIDVGVMGAAPRPKDRPATPSEWRGPRAFPARAEAQPLQGALTTESIDSKALNETRRLTIYTPPGFDPGRKHPVIYLADGESAWSFAKVLEPRILAGQAPPLVLVGLHSARGQRRNDEYLLVKRGGAAFEAHNDFFVREVLPFAQSRYGVSADRKHRLLMGYSNGGDWALDTALLHPRLFGKAAAFSPTGASAPNIDSEDGPDLFFSVGIFEPRQMRLTQDLAARGERAGKRVDLHVLVSGHSPIAWREAFARALAWAF